MASKANATKISSFEVAQLPQDPYLPQVTPLGPSFLDTQACLCALQTTPEEDSNSTAWQCVGNQTVGVYTSTQGMWFNTLHGGNEVDLPIYDASNGPDTTRPLIWNPTGNSLVPIANANTSNLSVFDKACTGRNRTTFSTALYLAASEESQGQTPVDAAPCWRPGAVPLQIQNVSDWQTNGCSEGFLCKW
jgi:hypothetical protein